MRRTVTTVNADPYTQPRQWPWPLAVTGIILRNIIAVAGGYGVVLLILNRWPGMASTLGIADDPRPMMVAAVLVAAMMTGWDIHGYRKARATTIRVWLERDDAGEWTQEGLSGHQWLMEGTTMNSHQAAIALATQYLDTIIRDGMPLNEWAEVARNIIASRVVVSRPDADRPTGRPRAVAYDLADLLSELTDLRWRNAAPDSN